jgi:hypothetical protein
LFYANAVLMARYTWDETLRILSCRPFHNWAAHACESLRYFATGHDDEVDTYEPSKPAMLDFDAYTFNRGR